MAEVTLTRSEPQRITFPSATAWRIRVDAESVNGSDPAVFLMRVHPADPETEVQEAELEAVCGPYDYVTYPVDTPSSERPYPFVRSSWFEIDLPSQAHAELVWDFVVEEVAALFRALKGLSELAEVTTLTVGEPEGSESTSN